jgi:acetylornithine deacetylase/succinyl-diaminopimelate desuccinylase-like protein
MRHVLPLLFLSACGDGIDDSHTLGSDLCADLSLGVAEVDPTRLMDSLTWLSSYDRRDGWETQTEIVGLLQDDLDDHGAATRLHGYTWRGNEWNNLVATFPADADLDPGEPHIVVGAHIDSTSEAGAELAPGADDNASGVAALLELARVLGQCPSLGGRVDLVFFTNEEAGTVGSSFYAGDAAAEGQDITAMIAVDMIAFGPEGEDLDLNTKPGQEWLPQAFADAATAWTELEVERRIDDHCG